MPAGRGRRMSPKTFCDTGTAVSCGDKIAIQEDRNFIYSEGGHPMSNNLDVIVLDDDLQNCAVTTELLEDFYVWGKVHPFTDYRKALSFCKRRKDSIGIFVLDVYLGKESAFDFLDAISDRYVGAAEDTIIITG